MVKIRVHIKNCAGACDENVYVEINLPSIPRINEVVILDNDLYLELENKARANLKVAILYNEYLYGESEDVEVKDLEEKHFVEDLDFQDAHYVYNVVYNSNSDIIKIELATNPKTYTDE